MGDSSRTAERMRGGPPIPVKESKRPAVGRVVSSASRRSGGGLLLAGLGRWGVGGRRFGNFGVLGFGRGRFFRCCLDRSFGRRGLDLGLRLRSWGFHRLR